VLVPPDCVPHYQGEPFRRQALLLEETGHQFVTPLEKIAPTEQEPFRLEGRRSYPLDPTGLEQAIWTDRTNCVRGQEDLSLASRLEQAIWIYLANYL